MSTRIYCDRCNSDTPHTHRTKDRMKDKKGVKCHCASFCGRPECGGMALFDEAYVCGRCGNEIKPEEGKLRGLPYASRME